MRDLDNDLTSLRTELAQSVRQPPLDLMIAQGRRRTVRRRLQLLAVVVAVFATGALPFLHAHTTTEPAGPGPDAVTHLISADFLDAHTGFVLGVNCGSLSTSCRPWLLAAGEDGVWRKRSTPPIDVQDNPGRMVALGNSDLVIDNQQPDNTVRRYFSADTGHTWQAVSADTGGTVAEIPAGAVIETKRTPRDGGHKGLCRGGISVTLPSTGTSAMLAVQPGFVAVWCQPYPDANGTWWVGGQITGRLAIASSHDDGRTWQVDELPGYEGQVPLNAIGSMEYPVIRVVSNRSATFAVLTNPIGDQELVAIYRKTGDGWTKTWQAGDGTVPFGVPGSPVAAPDGRLWIPAARNSEHGPPVNTWVSADDGRTLQGENWGPGPMSGKVEWTRGGYVSVGSQTGLYRSLEGMSWRQIELPTG
jgi:hypothetical protein